MNEDILGNAVRDAQSLPDGADSLPFSDRDGKDGAEPAVPSVSNGDAVYDIVREDGSVVYTLSPRSQEGEAVPSASVANMGYQVSDYWLNYFRGILQKLGDTDYVIFSTREYSGSNYVGHYYLYYGDSMFDDSGNFVPGRYRCVDGYSSSSIYYVSEYDNTLNTIATDRLMYSNAGSYSDIREGVSHYDSWALLFFLGFFAVYTVCHDIFDYVIEHVYRK